MTGVEDQPRVFDQDGNQIPLDKLAELLKKPHGVSQPRNNKRRQVIKDNSDQEYRLTPVPKTPKCQNAKTPTTHCKRRRDGATGGGISSGSIIPGIVFVCNLLVGRFKELHSNL
ncbi:hypothetical protein RhiJN_07035 [Ceratobasidium sp. AG-Ba]|nr:hypothetical protein RhiJN_07035 [Ceratobasidium sp. AG-Ba]